MSSLIIHPIHAHQTGNVTEKFYFFAVQNIGVEFAKATPWLQGVTNLRLCQRPMIGATRQKSRLRMATLFFKPL